MGDESVERLRQRANATAFLDVETERELLRRIREDGDQHAADRFLSSYLRLVMRIAKKYLNYNISFDDLVAEGNLGLVVAMRRFDPAKAGSSRFATYATWWITAYVRRFAIYNRRIVRPPGTREGRKLFYQLRRVERQLYLELGRTPTREELAAHFGIDLGELERVELVLSAHDLSIETTLDDEPLSIPSEGASPEALASSNLLVAKMLANAALSDREHTIIDRRLLSGSETLAEVSEVLGISRERVRQIEERAIGKLRRAAGVK